MADVAADVVIVGSGAGGGTVAQALAPLAEAGRRVLVLERGARFDPADCTGRETEMAPALYADAGGFLTEQGTLTLAFARAYGGSTLVYTGTSLPPPERVVEGWAVPGLEHADLLRRVRRYVDENNVHLLPDEEINENNRLFVAGCRAAGHDCHQFPVNVRGCRGSSRCNLGCPNGAKQGTNVVQLPRAEARGVQVVTRARVERVDADGADVVVSARGDGERGAPSEWTPGRHRVRAPFVVSAGGAVGTSALLLRSGLDRALPRLGRGFTCHPAVILVAEHDRPITNDVGHPKSFYLDRGAEEGYVLETCMYPPFVTAKSLEGMGPAHARFMDAFPRLQMILVLACDHALDENRVTVDDGGEPRVHYDVTDEVVRRLVLATRTAARIFFGAGAVRVHVPFADPPVLEREDAARIGERIHERHVQLGRASISAAHLMGGCAMGRDPGDSVTDDRGRVHGHQWLRVADASLFPDSVEVNPYLTVMALADRVAEGVLEDVA